MNSIDDVALQGLESLRRAVREELERKRLLGQYAVFWIDGKVVRKIPDPPEKPIALSTLNPETDGDEGGRTS